MAMSLLNARLQSFDKHWPHTASLAPSFTMQLAEAGFYFTPTEAGDDTATCFTCDKALGGWETGDDPLTEHYNHSKHCSWALLIMQQRKATLDPQGPEMMKAREASFAGWPYEKKRGWTVKAKKMANAGWHYTPSAESQDAVACIYCQTELDGWEPKDDPLKEHEQRARDLACAFFVGLPTAPPPVEEAAAPVSIVMDQPTSTAAKRRGRAASNATVQSDLTQFSAAGSTVAAQDQPEKRKKATGKRKLLKPKIKVDPEQLAESPGHISIEVEAAAKAAVPIILQSARKKRTSDAAFSLLSTDRAAPTDLADDPSSPSAKRSRASTTMTGRRPRRSVSADPVSRFPEALLSSPEQPSLQTRRSSSIRNSARKRPAARSSSKTRGRAPLADLEEGDGTPAAAVRSSSKTRGRKLLADLAEDVVPVSRTRSSSKTRGRVPLIVLQEEVQPCTHELGDEPMQEASKKAASAKTQAKAAAKKKPSQPFEKINHESAAETQVPETRALPARRQSTRRSSANAARPDVADPVKQEESIIEELMPAVQEEDEMPAPAVAPPSRRQSRASTRNSLTAVPIVFSISKPKTTARPSAGRRSSSRRGSGATVGTMHLEEILSSKGAGGYSSRSQPQQSVLEEDEEEESAVVQVTKKPQRGRLSKADAAAAAAAAAAAIAEHALEEPESGNSSFASARSTLSTLNALTDVSNRLDRSSAALPAVKAVKAIRPKTSGTIGRRLPSRGASQQAKSVIEILSENENEVEEVVKPKVAPKRRRGSRAASAAPQMETILAEHTPTETPLSRIDDAIAEEIVEEDVPETKPGPVKASESQPKATQTRRRVSKAASAAAQLQVAALIAEDDTQQAVETQALDQEMQETAPGKPTKAKKAAASQPRRRTSRAASAAAQAQIAAVQEDQDEQSVVMPSLAVMVQEHTIVEEPEPEVEPAATPVEVKHGLVMEEMAEKKLIASEPIQEALAVTQEAETTVPKVETARPKTASNKRRKGRIVQSLPDTTPPSSAGNEEPAPSEVVSAASPKQASERPSSSSSSSTKSVAAPKVKRGSGISKQAPVARRTSSRRGSANAGGSALEDIIGAVMLDSKGKPRLQRVKKRPAVVAATPEEPEPVVAEPVSMVSKQPAAEPTEELMVEEEATAPVVATEEATVDAAPEFVTDTPVETLQVALLPTATDVIMEEEEPASSPAKSLALTTLAPQASLPRSIVRSVAEDTTWDLVQRDLYDASTMLPANTITQLDDLTAAEREMTVEDWIRFVARREASKLTIACEEMIERLMEGGERARLAIEAM